MCWLLRSVMASSMAIVVVGCGASGERDELLKATPKGSSIEQVLSLCSSRGLQCHRSDTAGYLDQDTGKVVGVRSVWATIKTERSTLPMVSTTSAYWGFDRDGHLLDIWVWRTTDAP